VSTETKTVMIIGGGIAGLTAARELSRQNIRVELVEKADFLGGHAIQYACKATDECQQCGACKVEATLKEVVEAASIHVHLATEIRSITRNGGFTIQLAKSAVDKAAELKACDNGYNDQPVKCAGLRGYSKHNAKYYTADGRLNPETTAQAGQVKADAVILASGFAPFDATRKSTYRYGDLANVITGLDLERGKRASGKLVRPSDGQPPQKIAFIQCVGSRDERLGNLWCSQVCCPYALRTAMSLKHKNPELDITIFYMDIQNTGNNFATFYQQCQDGLKFVRTIPVDMYPVEDGRIQTRYMTETDGTPVEEVFDLVVLSVGIMPGSDNQNLAETLNIALNSDGFAAAQDALDTTATQAEGIFLAGTVHGPKTIANTMAHAGQSAGNVIAYLRRAS
jgi:heterodisulfide reductase subunit A2